MDRKKLDDMIHRAQMNKYLSKDELKLPDAEREKLLLERRLVDEGALREEDLFLNRASLHEYASKTIPKDLQLVGLVMALGLAMVFFDKGAGIQGALWLFVKTIPICALGLLIFKVAVKDDLQKPKSWPEWIGVYIVGLMVGGPSVALVKFLFGKLFA